MKRLGSRFTRRAILACATLALMSFPILVWAQGSTPPPTTPATPPATPPAKPAVTAPAPAPGDTAHKMRAMTDAQRTAFRTEVDHQLKQMADSLKLTPQQRANARPILLDHAYQVKQLRDKYVGMERTPANREAMTKEMQTLREATDTKLAGVLSADQMTQYKKMRDEQLARVRSRVAGGETKPPEKK